MDYDYQILEGCSFALRGPLNFAMGKKTITCLGSAATFGRFARQPFSHILASKSPWNVINLGFGGARFETYLRESALLDLCRKSDLIILELMSARSYNSHIFTPSDHLGGVGSLAEKYKKRIRRECPDSALLSDQIYINDALRWAAKNLDWQDLELARNEILLSYRLDAIRLIKEIGRPVLLLWFSQRKPEKKPRPGTVRSWSCNFPHFVDRETVKSIEQHTLGTVEIISKTGLPSQLISLSQGKPVSRLRGSSSPTLNGYYPSPEMHNEAAESLLTRIKGIL